MSEIDALNGFAWPGLVHPVGVGKALHSATIGVGRDVVVLPGNGCSMEDFGPVAARLARDYRVTGVHVPGREPVLWPDESIGFTDELPGVVERVIDGAGVGRFVAVGHSMGGMLAIQLARAMPGRVAGLVLVEGFVSLETHFRVVSRASYKPVAMSDEILAAWKARQEKNGAWNKARPAFFKGFWEGELKHDARGWIGALEVPILQVMAAHPEGKLPAEGDLEAWRATLEMGDVKDLEVCVVPESGHWPMLDQPKLVYERISKFLKRVH
jgi:pimeloyl-ACP methyl ester carboxylesterase